GGRRAARAAGLAAVRSGDRDLDRVRGDDGRDQRVQRRAGGRPRRLPVAVRGPMIAFITGAAHGQGRATAQALARDGYDIVGLDIAETLPYPGYEMGSPEDLESLRKSVEALGQQCLTVVADVRDNTAVAAGVAAAIERFGRIDVLFNNAGICAY